MKNLINTFSLLKTFILRFYKFHFAGSYFKLLWSLFIPVALAFAITLVFKNVFSIKEPQHSLIIFSGFIFWLFISGTIQQSHRLFLDQRQFYKQCQSRHLLIPAFILFRFILFLPGILLIFVFCSASFTIIHLAGFILLFLMTLFCLSGFSYLLSTWTVFCPDLSHVLDILLLFLLWLSPVFYPTAAVPLKWRFLIYINPLTWYLDFLRFSLKLNHYFHPYVSLMAFSCFSFFICFFGFFYYQKHKSELLKML